MIHMGYSQNCGLLGYTLTYSTSYFGVPKWDPNVGNFPYVDSMLFLRSKRSTIYNLYRLPLNAIVVLTLILKLGEGVSFTAETSEKGLAACNS